MAVSLADIKDKKRQILKFLHPIVLRFNSVATKTIDFPKPRQQKQQTWDYLNNSIKSLIAVA